MDHPSNGSNSAESHPREFYHGSVVVSPFAPPHCEDLADIIEEVTRHIHTIAQESIEVSTRQYFSRFLQDTQQLYQAHQQELLNRVDEKLEHFRREILAYIDSCNSADSLDRSCTRSSSPSSSFILERKLLVDSIISPRPNDSVLTDRVQEDPSQDCRALKDKMDQLERKMEQQLEKRERTLAKTLERVLHDLETMKAEAKASHGKSEEQVVDGLAGMWNVISSMESKLTALEDFNRKQYQVNKSFSFEKSMSSLFRSVR